MNARSTVKGVGEPADRFDFGKNWSGFLAHVGEKRIAEAERSLRTMLETEHLRGKTFVDVGSGSGLFSLAARRLGATVRSLDVDAGCVRCTEELRRRYRPNDPDWIIGPRSILDPEFIHSLGEFDIVYSWGVLHHTGDLWKALDGVVRLVKPGGKLFIAIYNDAGWKSRVWTRVKATYCRSPRFLKMLIAVAIFMRGWGPRLLLDLARLRPLHSWRNYYLKRGMSPWHDIVDWAGGYPFEVAGPEPVIDFLKQRHFRLCRLKAAGRGSSSNNEFVFER